MAPPNPPPSTHQALASDAPKRRKHRRHASQQPQPLVELPSPAPTERAGGSAPHPAISTTAVPIECPDLTAAATGDDLMAEQAVIGARIKAGKQASSSKHRSLLQSADITVPGKVLQPVGTVNPGDLGPIGRRGRGEGVEGLAGLLPGSTNSVMPGNGASPNLAGIRPVGAPEMFDHLPERDSCTIPRCDAQLEDGEVWEKGPAMVVRDGNSVRAIFSPSTHSSVLTMPGSGDAEQYSTVTCNASHTRRPRASGRQQDELYALADSAGPCLC